MGNEQYVIQRYAKTDPCLWNSGTTLQARKLI
jgi:hypothetical protein